MSDLNGSQPPGSPPPGDDGGGARKFVWPPARDRVIQVTPSVGVPGESKPRAAPSFSELVAERGAASRSAAPTGRPQHTARAMVRGSLDDDGWWEQVERVWLGVNAPPLLQRAREAAWVPDGVEHYCRRCGATREPGEAPIVLSETSEACERCQAARLAWGRFIRLGEYEPPLDRWIHEVKFTRFRRLGEGLGVWLGEAIAAEIERSRVRIALPPEVVIVPVPMSGWRRWTRGIDHTLTIARGVRRATGGTIVRALRRAHRPSQLDVRPSDRTKNLVGAFRLAKGSEKRLRGRLVVVVDDVSTTGATLSACVRILKGLQREGKPQSGSAESGEIWAAALAWTAEHRRTAPMT